MLKLAGSSSQAREKSAGLELPIRSRVSSWALPRIIGTLAEIAGASGEKGSLGRVRPSWTGPKYRPARIAATSFSMETFLGSRMLSMFACVSPSAARTACAVSVACSGDGGGELLAAHGDDAMEEAVGGGHGHKGGALGSAADWPKMRTRLGSPPNSVTSSRTHWRARTRSSWPASPLSAKSRRLSWRGKGSRRD